MHCLVVTGFIIAVTGQVSGDAFILRGTKKHDEAAVAKGRAEADAELNSGKASIWVYGHIPIEQLFFEHLDRETGLYHSGFGCVVDGEIIGRVEGHNARIAEHIRKHGPPKNSFKPWEKELFGLKEYFESRCRTGAPTRLTVGGPAAISPDKGYTVKLVKRPDKTLEGQPTESTWIVVGDQDIESRRTSLWMKDAELFWGPKASWFAVLRGASRTDDGQDYMALDVREARTIRVEFGAKPARRISDPYDVAIDRNLERFSARSSD
jgi:hypothetical protein